MVQWTASEAEFLQASWARSGNALALPVACPNCLHNGAFSAVVLLPWAPTHRGLESSRPEDEVRPTFPLIHIVTCACAEHDGAKGCGRSGYVKVQVPE